MSDTLGIIQYQALSTEGQPLADINIAILSGDITTVVTTTQPGSPLATLYTDPTGDTTTPNPTMTDGLGNLNVSVAPGYYVLQIYGPGVRDQLLVQVVASAPTGSGSVLSVGLTMPSDTFTVTGSPVTSTGTLAVTEKTQHAGYDYTGPQFPPVAAPTWKPGYKKQIFNVLTYGADPTGVTDSTTAVQNCINAACAYNPASQSTGTVYFPTGSYTISSTLTDTGQGVGSVIGDPGGLSILQVPNSSATNAIFNFMNCNTIAGVCRDLTFIGPANYTGGTTGGTKGPVTFGLTDGDLQDWTFDNLRFFQWGGNALSLLGPIVCKVSNIRMLFCMSGIYCSQGTSTVVTDCYALQTPQWGYHFFEMSYSSCINCACDFGGISYAFDACNACSWLSCGHEAGVATNLTVTYTAVSGTAASVVYSGPDMSSVYYFNMPFQCLGTTNGGGILNGRWRVDSLSPNSINFTVNPGIAPFAASDTGTASFFPGDGFVMSFCNACVGYNCKGTDAPSVNSTDYIMTASFNCGFRDCISILEDVGFTQTFDAYLGGSIVPGQGFGFNNNQCFLENFEPNGGIAGQGQLAVNATETIWIAGNKATSSANYSAPPIGFFSTYWNGTATTSDIWQIGPGLGNGTNPSSALVFSHSGPPSSFAGVNFILGNASNAGSVNLIANTPATNSFSAFSPEFGLTGNYWDIASLSNTDTFALVNEVQPGTEPETILTLLHQGSGNNFVLSACGNASAGHTTYTGIFPTSSDFSGQTVIIGGFGTIVDMVSVNNGEFTVVSSNSTTMVVNNPNGVAESGAIAQAYITTIPGNGYFNVGMPLSLVGSAIAAPTSAGTAGIAGQMVFYSGELYICTVTGAAGSATWDKFTKTSV